MKPQDFSIKEPINKKQSIKMIDDFHREYNKPNLIFSYPEFENLALRILPSKYRLANGDAPKNYVKVLKDYIQQLRKVKRFSNPKKDD